jgi:two-component system sensor histidine kinase HupT/HoxJ
MGRALDAAGGIEALQLNETQEAAWIEVIRKMDEVYAGLLHYEVDLENKNAALEDAQNFIGSVLASMSDVLIVCDRDGRIQQANRAAETLTGFPAADLIGKPLEDILAAGCRGMAEGFCPREGGEVQDHEVRFVAAAGGETDPVAVNCTARLDHDGRRAGLVLIGRPVGELRRAYEALNQAHRTLQDTQQQLVQSAKMASIGRLVAGVAHELNNPISFVYGNAHSLEKYAARLETYLAAIHCGVPEREREGLRRDLRIDEMMHDLPSLVAGTKEGAERTRDIIASLKRLSFTGNPADRETFDLGEAVTTAIKWAVRGRRAMPSVETDLPEGLAVRGHPGQIQQVVVNILENALDALERTNQDRHLTIVGERARDTVRVRFRDTGPGIRPDDLLKVFDPFFTTKAVGQGMGLGLWISYDIVRGHGGSLEVANHPEGGAIFTLTLPAARNGKDSP